MTHASEALHAGVLRQGVRAWNGWRRTSPGIVPLLNDLNVSIGERQFGHTHGGPINFSLTELRRARLSQATLTAANLMGAVLAGADLADARLEGADLRGANLAHANLSGTRLEGANLCGANLCLAKGLTQAQVDQAFGDRRTALPADLTRPTAWLHGGQPKLSQLASRSHRADLTGDESSDTYDVLGVAPETPVQRVPVAWLKRISDLKRDNAGATSGSERLKATNQAYQRLKEREPQAIQRHPERRRWVSAAVLLVVAIALGALIAAVETHLAQSGHPGGAPRSPLNARHAPSGAPVER